MHNNNKNILKANNIERGQEKTRTMPSLVAIETVSAQETTPGQAFSSSSLIKSILSKPFKVLLGIACLSMELFLSPLLSSKRTEASQP
jgi:hypothetical protein